MFVDIYTPIDDVWDSFKYDPDSGDFYWKNGDLVNIILQNNYPCVFWKERAYALHRIAWVLMTGCWPECCIDHVDRDKTNNRWANLRAATWQQNCQNRSVHSNNKLGIRGIRMNYNKFEPRLMKNGVAIYLGLYKTLAEAVEARKNAEKEYFTHAQ